MLVARTRRQSAQSRRTPSHRMAARRKKCEGATGSTGNRSARSRPLAPSQPPPRIAIAGDVPPRGRKQPHQVTRFAPSAPAGRDLVLAGLAWPPRDRDRRPSAAAVAIWWRPQSARRTRYQEASSRSLFGSVIQQFLSMPASRSGKFALEKVRLILIFEADLEPNAAVTLGNRPEQSWADIAMIQPNADSAHSLAEGTSRLSFDLHNEWIERHTRSFQGL